MTATVAPRFDFTHGGAFLFKASGRSTLTREPKQIDAQLGKQTGAELSALFVRRCLDFPHDEARRGPCRR